MLLESSYSTFQEISGHFTEFLIYPEIGCKKGASRTNILPFQAVTAPQILHPTFGKILKCFVSSNSFN